MNRKKVVLTIVFLILMMILYAVTDNIRGVLFPVFKGEFKLNNFQLSLLAATSYTGYLIFTYIAGYLCGSLGQRRVLLMGLFIIGTALLLMSILHSYYALLIGMFLTSSGAGFINLGVNTLIPVLFISLQGFLINFVHFSYGFGATATQRFTGLLLSKGVGFPQIYLVLAIASFVLAGAFMLVKLPVSVKGNKAGSTSVKGILRNKIVIFYIFILGFYVVAEHGTSNWFVIYVQNMFGFDSDRSSFYVSLFFILLTIGRLVGGIIAEKYGEFKVLKIFFTLAFILYLSGLVMGERWIMAVSVSGFFFSIIFPTTVYSINRVFKENSAYVTSVIISLSTVFDIVTNFLIGGLNDFIGYRYTFYIMPVSLVLGLVFISLVEKNVLRPKSTVTERVL